MLCSTIIFVVYRAFIKIVDDNLIFCGILTLSNLSCGCLKQLNYIPTHYCMNCGIFRVWSRKIAIYGESIYILLEYIH